MQAIMGNTRRIADLSEQLVVLVLYFWLVARLWPQEPEAANWYVYMLFVSEGVTMAFILIRRATEKISLTPQDWIIAFGGTFFVLLVGKGGDPIHATAGGMVILVGFCIHFGSKLTLRRSFGLVPADRGIKVRGPYALVRHPMYFGYIVAHIGYLLAAPSLWNLAVYICAWALFVARILAEERVLSLNPTYRAYQEKVPYRLIPGLY